MLKNKGLVVVTLNCLLSVPKIVVNQRLERLIDALDGLGKGEGLMKNEYEVLKNQYAEEVKQRWGNTAAYKEFEQPYRLQQSCRLARCGV